MRLAKEFFEKQTLWVAENLLGKFLVRRWRGKEIRTLITETEAYCGFNDRASHASRGMTLRNKVMFGPAGFAYVYLIYGMHYCLNVVTEQEGYPAAVLIRGVNQVDFPNAKLNGPGKLTKALHIDKSLNGENIVASRKLWIEANDRYRLINVKKGRRIGVDYAGSWAKKPWRFWI
jgi:DNA-3-methyladenine glycosylase